MIRRYPGVGNLTVCRCEGVGNLALASIKMSNFPGSAPPPPPWGLTLIGALQVVEWGDVLVYTNDVL